jgi:hypothetical protein
MPRKRPLSEVALATPTSHTAPTLKEYMWGELRRLLREHAVDFSSGMSTLSKKKFK